MKLFRIKFVLLKTINLRMKKYIFYIFVLLFISGGLNAQQLRDILIKNNQTYRQDFNNKDIRTLSMELIIKTPKGEVPARLIISDNIGYKLTLLSKSNQSEEIVNQKAMYLIDENGKPTKNAQIGSNEYTAKKDLLKINPIAEFIKDDFPQERIEYMGVVEGIKGARQCHGFRVRDENFDNLQELFFDIEKFKLIKKIHNYTAIDGSYASEVSTYMKYIIENEFNFSYASEFSTIFGMATVSSIKINKDNINPAEFDPR
jgi:hypothetical protein